MVALGLQVNSMIKKKTKSVNILLNNSNWKIEIIVRLLKCEPSERSDILCFKRMKCGWRFVLW